MIGNNQWLAPKLGQKMRYPDGQIIMLGDKVDLGGQMTGVVVCSLEDKLFSPDFPESTWTNLKTGILVDSPQWGLIHFPEPNIDLVLIERATTKS